MPLFYPTLFYPTLILPHPILPHPILPHLDFTPPWFYPTLDFTPPFTLPHRLLYPTFYNTPPYLNSPLFQAEHSQSWSCLSISKTFLEYETGPGVFFGLLSFHCKYASTGTTGANNYQLLIYWECEFKQFISDQWDIWKCIFYRTPHTMINIYFHQPCVCDIQGVKFV